MARIWRPALAVLLLAALLSVAPVASTTPAEAGPADNFSLAKSDSVGGEALIGEEITYSLTATGTQASAAYLYNLSFRDVLPVGVSYVSADPPATEILADVPSPGQTTVIWSNVSDLPANSQAGVSVTVDTNPDFAGGSSGSATVPVGSIITNDAEAVASLDAFTVPDYSTATGGFTGDFDGSAAVSHSVDVIPFRVTKSGPAELLRGVHGNGFDGASGTIGALYTVTVENNPDYAVNAVTLVDTLEPILEFLGCGAYYPADNTTVGEEWTGSGPVATGACPGLVYTPNSVVTGPGGETAVDWTLGNLAPGQVIDVNYHAGIPLYANQPFGGATPTPASLGQGRNLDNNTGPSTGESDRTTNPDPELLSAPEQSGVNTATGTGTYTPAGTLGSDTSVFTTESEDLAIEKSMAGTLNHGTTVSTTLTITTSEYRDFSDLVVRDLLPSALCFLGTYNVDATPGGSDWSTTDCPGAGSIQSTINGVPVDVAQVRELPDGGPYGTGRFELVWDFADADNAALADLDADGTLTITYSAVVRQFYRGGLAQLPGEPVLAGDSVTNEAEVSGPDVVADPILPADPVDPDGGIDGDTASSGIENDVASIDKRISVKAGPMVAGVTAATCSSSYASITWSEGDPTPELGYGPGDIVCFELGASFPGSVNYEGTTIQDLLPPGYAYLPGSATRIPAVDTLPGTTVTESPAIVTFIASGTGEVDGSGNFFRWVIAAEITDNTAGVALDINANLQKLVHNNNGGLVFQLRDQAAAEWTEPQVRLAKGVDTVNAGASNGPDFDGSLTGGSTTVEVTGGDVVTYRLDVWNTGSTDALATEIHDVVPSGFTCADISAVSNGGTCSSGRITWPTQTIPGSVGGADTTPDDETTAPLTLTYDLTVPNDVDPDNLYTNTAGVAHYQGQTNTGVYDYYPTGNIDPANAALENTDPSSDQAFIEIRAITITKLQQSAIAEAGNIANPAPATGPDQATIGEIVQYQITATIPEGTTVYDAVITDVLPAGASWFTGMGLFAGTVSDLQPTIISPTGDVAITAGTLANAAGTVTYTLPTPYANPNGSGDDDVAITFYAIIDDVAANTGAPATQLSNSAGFDWNDAIGGDRPDVVSPSVITTVVEPNPAIDKIHTAPAGTEVLPGDAITYQITVTNPSTPGNVSVAHDVTIVDTVPSGLTPLGVGAVPVSTDGDLVPSTGVTPAGAFTGTWSETNHEVIWTSTDWSALDAVDPDATAQFTYQAEVDDPAVSSGVLTNTADLTGSSLDQNLAPTEDPNEGAGRVYTGNDDNTLTLPLASVVKDLEPFNPVDPTDDRATFTVGEPVDFEVTATIPNGSVVYDGTLFDDFPTTLDFDSFGPITIPPACEVFDAVAGATTGTSLTPGDVETFHPVSGDAGLAAWFFGDIYGNGDCEITVAYTLHVNDTAFDADTISNDALLTWNDSDQITTQSPAALPAGFDTPGSASWTNNDGPVSETFAVVEPAMELDKDVAEISGAPLANPTCDTTPGNNNGGSDDADGTPANGCDTTAGAQLRYTVTITSVGTSDSHDVTVVDSVPAGLTPLTSPGGPAVTTTGQTVTGASGSAGLWDESAHTITWFLSGPYSPTATGTVDYDAVVDASDDLARGQELTNGADIPSFFGLSSVDRSQILLDNPANDDLATYGNGPAATRGSLTADAATVEVHFPQLAITKSPAGGQDVTDVRLDVPFTWDITISNTDTVASAFNVDAADVLPEGWTYDLGSATVTTPSTGATSVDPTCAADFGACGQGGVLNVETLVWSDLIAGPADPLAPGQQITISFTATPQSAALTSTQAIGEAHSGYDGGLGFAHTNNAGTTGEDASGSTTCCDPDGPGGVPAEPYGAADSDDVFIARSDIEVDKAISPLETDADPTNGPYWFGSWVNYTITVDNLGPDPATGVQISDVLDPTELAFDSVVSIDQGTFDSATNIWDIGAVADGASLMLTLRTRLVGLGSVTNIAQDAATDQYDSDSIPGNSAPAEDDQDSVTIEIVPTSLGDYVWLDLNGDGVQDPTEPGIPGVEVDLTWTDPGTGLPQSYTTTTGADGSYGVPPAVGLPSNTDITVTIDVAASPNLIGLAPSFDRDGTLDHTATEQVTATDTTLPTGALADLDFDYGYTPDLTQSIGDKVWWDQDNSADATNGAGEAGIPNVDVSARWAGFDGIFGTGDDLTFVETTDAAGDYLFADLPPGNYEVTVDVVDLPAGLDTATFDLDGGTPSTASVVLDPAEDQLDVDFSYTGAGTIGDTVWFDHNGDGTIDPGEPGLGGVTVTATWDGPDGIAGNADDVVLTTTTAADGTYTFANLPHGEFVVTVDDTTLPGGLTQTFDADGTATAHLSIATLDAVTTTDTSHDFGYQGSGTIGDTVFFDVDGIETDGLLDLGDAPIVGVDVTVVWAGADGTIGTADDFTFTDTTDASGTYGVTELPHGDYTVTVDTADLPAGLDSPTFDADGVASASVSAVTLTAVAPSNADQDFSYTGEGAGLIGDIVWFDQNADGIEDPGEVGFSGVTVDLVWFGPDGVLGGGDDVTQTTVTDATGSYLFDNLPDGNFSVTVDPTTLPTGLAQTFDADGTATADTSAVTLSPANPSSLDQDFGYTGVGSLGDQVWLDIDGSGTAIPDAGEPGIPGVDLAVVWTNPQGADATYSVTTDSTGAYNLPNLPHGSYAVSVVPATLPPGLAPTYDADGTGSADSSVVVLDATTPDNPDQDFSYTGTGSIGDTVWFDQDADGAVDPAGTGVFTGQDQPLAGIDITVTWGGFDGVIGDDPVTTSVDESADDISYPATTDANGEYLVSSLPFGPYEITVDDATLPSGVDVATFDADGVVSPHGSQVGLDATTPDNLDQDFSYTGAGAIGDTVWFDLDGDGVFDADEVALAGVTVTLDYTGPDGTTVTVSTVTDASGSYLFENLPFDTPMTVTIDDTTLPPGLAPTFDADGTATAHTAVTTLTAAAPTDTTQDFGYNGSGSIGDTVWYDRDNSSTATLDAVDVGIPNVIVTVTWTNPTGAADLVVAATTDANGQYAVSGLAHGDYTVTVDPLTLPDGVTPTFDADGVATVDASSVTLDAATPDNLDQDFSYTGLGAIGDTVWNDDNGDGVIDPTESLLGGVTVNLAYEDPVTGMTFTDTTVTAADGTYAFDNLPAGDYVISVDPATLPAGSVPTFDADGAATPHAAAVSLGNSEIDNDVDFGSRPEADLSVVKAHVGDFEIGADNTWTISVANAGPAPAQGPIVITDTLPAGTAYVAAAGSEWDCSAAAGSVACTYVDAATGLAADLPPGGAVSVDLIVAVDASAAPSIDNTAQVMSPTVDSDPSNNVSTDSTSAPLSVLDVVKVLDGSLRAGDDATYEITVTNLGPSPTRGPVTIVDDLPSGLSYESSANDVAGASCSASGQTVTCTNPGVMAVGSTWTVTLVVDVSSSSAGSTLTNSASVSGGNLVNGTQLPAATLGDIYDRLNDPNDSLAQSLGIAAGSTPNGSVAVGAFVAAQSALAFTGTNIIWFVLLALFAIIVGLMLERLGRRRFRLR